MADIANDAKLKPDGPLMNEAAKLCFYLWKQAWRHAAGTVEGVADDLHDMRVMIRRLRSAMQNFEGSKGQSLLDERLRREFTQWRDKLGRVGDALGAVRDFDVLDGYLKDYARVRLNSEVAASPGLTHLERFFQTERARALGPMVERVNKGLAPGKLREQFGRFALGLPAVLTPELTLREAAQQIGPQLVETALTNAAALDDGADSEGHHELRKALKRLRYALEAFATTLNTLPQDSIKRITVLQDLLGEMHDRDVLHEWAHKAFGRDADVSTHSGDAQLPDDVSLFLGYGDRRRRRLLGQVRVAWKKCVDDGVIAWDTAS